MANKRILKKQIKYICGEVALQCIITRECFNGNSDKLNELIIATADLQESTLKKVTFSFDKTAKAFAHRAEYQKAATAYFKQAYGVLQKEFNGSIQEILKKLNAEMPAEQREANKQAAAK